MTGTTFDLTSGGVRCAATHVAGEDAEGRLRSAIRFGSATASLPGTRLAAPADLATHDVPIRPLGGSGS